MNSRFLNFIDTLVEIPEGQKQKFEALITTKQLNRGDFYVRQGQYPNSIAFLTKGLFRYFYLSNRGEEFTKGFFTENTVLSAYSALIENRVAYFSIEALEDSEIEVVNYLEFQKLLKENPCWNEFLIVMLQKAFVIKETREREFLLLDAEERYKGFLERFPDLENRVKQNLIASYLGIAPESLSRVRKKMGLLT
jgi:CRP-like cAMP-binding protein